MNLSKQVQVLTSWCAFSPQAAEDIFPQLVMAVPPELYGAWRKTLETIHAPRLARILTLARSHGGLEPLDLSRLHFANDDVLWDGTKIGELRTYFKTVLPYEAQARVAYDIFFDRFGAFVSARYRAVVLQQSDFDLNLFVPEASNLDLNVAWRLFIRRTYSLSELIKNVAPLVNSVPLADSGLGRFQVPIVTQDQATFLAAFYLANLEYLKSGDAKLEREITQLREKMDLSDSEKKRGQLEKQIAEREQKLMERRERYGAAYQKLEAFERDHSNAVGQLRSIQRGAFRDKAGRQLKTTKDVVKNCVSELITLLQLNENDLYSLPLQLLLSPPAIDARPAGDSGSQICYCCGKKLSKHKDRYEASRLVFQTGSQRTQSGGGQVQPDICAVCAAVSFVSPIKLGGGRLVIRMREKGEQESYLVDEQLRMLTMGEMNVVAGKYAMLQASEKIGKGLVFDKLGGLQYAIHRVGIAFEPEVFERYDIEALIGNDLVRLPNRYLAWLNCLDKIFGLSRPQSMDKSQFAAYGKAIRHIQQEEVIFANYELLTSELVTLPLNAVRASQLEQLRSEHVRWLDMDNLLDRAQFFKDVAAMTGLLYPFCSYVRSEVRKAGGNERIEVRKVIERSDDPFQVNYTVAGNTQHLFATLYRSADLHFSYDQLKGLLVKLDINPAERETTDERGQLSLRLFFDDVVKAYAHLYETRYKTKKDQRDFAYELKLSLYSHFPDLIESEKKGD